MEKGWVKKYLEVIFSERSRYSFKPEAYILLFGFLICIVAWTTTENLNLVGHKSTSIFDIWTIVHISTGAVLGFFLIGFRRINIHHPILLLLLLSSMWEIGEHYIEIMGSGPIANWFAGEESIYNRLIADQLSLVVGFTIIKYKPKFLPIAIILSVGILMLHIILGDSMYFFK